MAREMARHEGVLVGISAGAALAAAKGLSLVIVMPDTMSEERRLMISAFGAKLILTEGRLGMQGAVDRAEQLHREVKNSLIVGQFVNPANPAAHYKTTGPEIWEDTEGRVDAFVAGVGTGGTVTGVGRFLKEKNPRVRIVAVEPASSPVLSGGKSGPHAIQGIGAGFVPDNFDRSVCDEILTVTDEDAYPLPDFWRKKKGFLRAFLRERRLPPPCVSLPAKKIPESGLSCCCPIPGTGICPADCLNKILTTFLKKFCKTP